MQHVMLDLETLDTTADAVILSIGAVKFDLESDALDDKGFYAAISVEANLAKGRKISESTLSWWMQQSEAARAVFKEEKHDLGQALDELAAWFEREDMYVWSNGASFDIPMLTHAYRQFDWETPWKHFNTRCFRTFKNLPGMDRVSRTSTGIAHNALADAVSQAMTLQAMYAALKKGGGRERTHSAV